MHDVDFILFNKYQNMTLRENYIYPIQRLFLSILSLAHKMPGSVLSKMRSVVGDVRVSM